MERANVLGVGLDQHLEQLSVDAQDGACLGVVATLLRGHQFGVWTMPARTTPWRSSCSIRRLARLARKVSLWRAINASSSDTSLERLMRSQVLSSSPTSGGGRPISGTATGAFNGPTSVKLCLPPGSACACDENKAS